MEKIIKRQAHRRTLEKKGKDRYKSLLKLLSIVFIFILLFLGIFLIKNNRDANNSLEVKKNIVNISYLKDRNISSTIVKTIEELVYYSDKFENYSSLLGFDFERFISKASNIPSSSHSIQKRRFIENKKPELVLIIDDISQARQLKAIKAIPYRITPSIFPPSKMNEHSNKLVRNLHHYMIHLPMESGSVKMNSFEKTLMINYSKEKIENRIKEIRKLFPKAKFVNNHTGSVFTSNYRAMKIAYEYLEKEGFVFIDSRTSRKSKVKKIANIFHKPYISRDIFLDNIQNEKYILNQLKKAVNIARKRGYAIAIGHPHKATLNALLKANSILSKVRVVYIDTFYKEHYGKGL